MLLWQGAQDPLQQPPPREAPSVMLMKILVDDNACFIGNVSARVWDAVPAHVLALIGPNQGVHNAEGADHR